MKITTLIFSFLFNYILTEARITDLQKIKVRACMKLQSKKYNEEEEKITHFIEHMSKELNADPKQILYISLSICYKIIPEQYARYIHKINGELNINRNNTVISKIYDFEYYNYDDIEFIKKAYKEFYPIFEIIRDELKNQKRSFEGFQFHFTRSPLFKFFLWYFIINTIIVFYKRIKYPPDFIDNGNEDKNKDKKNKQNKEEIEEEEKEQENKKKKGRKKKEKIH